VRVKEDFVPGHIRMPAYIRGKTGVVVTETPVYPFPDAHAHGVKAADEPHLRCAIPRRGPVAERRRSGAGHVGVFQSYLETLG